jgi:hypothetical protein
MDGGDQRGDFEQLKRNLELLIVFNLYPQGVIQHPLMGIDVI